MPTYCPYAKLGVDCTASAAEIRQQFRILSMKFHPAQWRIIEEIFESHKLLNNEVKRKVFDHFIYLGSFRTAEDYSRAWQEAQKWTGQEHMFNGSNLDNVINQRARENAWDLYELKKSIEEEQRMAAKERKPPTEVADEEKAKLILALQEATVNLTKTVNEEQTARGRLEKELVNVKERLRKSNVAMKEQIIELEKRVSNLKTLQQDQSILHDLAKRNALPEQIEEKQTLALVPYREINAATYGLHHHRCDICGEVLLQKSDLLKHMETHSKEQNCNSVFCK